MSTDELNALTAASRLHFRQPRDHARFLLREALGLGPPLPELRKHEGAVLDVKPSDAFEENQF